jgi:hypothetical protein
MRTAGTRVELDHGVNFLVDRRIQINLDAHQLKNIEQSISISRLVRFSRKSIRNIHYSYKIPLGPLDVVTVINVLINAFFLVLNFCDKHFDKRFVFETDSYNKRFDRHFDKSLLFPSYFCDKRCDKRLFLVFWFCDKHFDERFVSYVCICDKHFHKRCLNKEIIHELHYKKEISSSSTIIIIKDKFKNRDFQSCIFSKFESISYSWFV